MLPNTRHTGEDVVEYARTLLGRPWQHQARGDSPTGSVDCVGLLIMIAKKFSLEYTDVKGYRREGGKELIQHLFKFTDKSPYGKIEAGTIGIFTDGVMPAHVGIFTSDKSVVHAEAFPKRRVVEEDYGSFAGSITAKLITVRRFRGIEYV